ncbi:MAG: PH domain-containing protein [Eubacteriales bacterium]
MKRFDKGYIFSNLISDLFYSFVILLVFSDYFFLEDSANTEDIVVVTPVFVIAFIIVFACFIAYRIMYYRTSGYELTETEIKCNRGVFFRKRSVLEYKKVHAINKKQNILQRIFGIAVLTVDSGSTNTSSQAEILIVEKEKTVDALLEKLNSFRENGAQNTESTTEGELLLSDKDSLYSFTSKKKMLYTLFNIVSTAFFTVLFGALAFFVIGACKFVLQLVFFGNWGEFFLLSFMLTLAAMLLFSAISFISCLINSFVGYHKFNITKIGNNIQISYGLLERHTNTFGYDRVKAVKISQSLVQRMFGFAAIKLEVIGYTSEEGKNDVELGVLVPFCKYNEVGEILNRVLPDYVPDKKQEKSVSFFPFMSWFLLFFGIITGAVLLLTTVITLILNAPSYVISAVVFSVLGVASIVLIVRSVSALLEYKTNGITIHNGKITVYSGSFSKKITVFKTENLVATEDITTPLRNRKGIASYVLHLKTNALSNEVKVHIQKGALSEELEGLLKL